MAVGLTLALACSWASATQARAAVVRAKAPATVRVPRLEGGVIAAYGRLHAAGLRVSIPAGLTFSSAAPPAVTRSVPATGRRVRRGSVVVLHLASRPAHPAVARGRPRTLTVARFVAAAASTAYSWVRAQKVALTAHLGPLNAGGAPGLLANYRVSRQRPGAGGRLTWGASGGSARGAPVRVPVTVWAAQPAPSAQTSSPTATGLTTATVAGTALTYGAPTTLYFEYGTTRRYGFRTPSQLAPMAERARVSASLSGLTPATTYHYRLVAVSARGTSLGADRTFTSSGYYQNPVYPAALPDPFVLDNGGSHSDYWVFATGNLFPVLHSTDLVHWTARGTALAARPKWVTKAANWHPWAPSVLQTSQACPGTASSRCYVMYYVGLNAALNVNCIGVATSPTPGGPYRDQGPLALEPGAAASAGSSSTPIGCGDSAGDGNIDPSPFVDASGQGYLYVSTDRACSSGSCTLKPTISVIPLAADFQHAAGSRVPLLSGDPGTWEAAGVPAPTVEGPAVELHDGTYYLFYSGGSWQGAYGSGYATAPAATGPFTKAPANPILAMSSAVRTPGGGDVPVTGPHQGTWLLYAGRAQTYTASRTLRLDRLSWQAVAGGPDAPVIAGPTTTPQAVQP